MPKEQSLAPPADDAVLIPLSPALQGAATVTQHPVPVIANAVWTIVDDDEDYGRCASTTILGGYARVYRRADNGKLQGRWVVKDADGAVLIDSSTPLTAYETVAEAQIAYEAIIRESLAKTHPEIAAAGAQAEHVERLTQAGEDPF